MAVYVDPLVDYGKSPWRGTGQACHMMTDGELSELHDMMVLIGGSMRWFQNQHKTMPHYDLSPSMRAKAVANGAIEVSQEEMLLRCRRVDGRVIEFREYTALETDLRKVSHGGHGDHIPYATAACPACGIRKRVGWRGFKQRWLLMCSCGKTCYITEETD